MKTTCHICGKEISRPSAIKMHIETMHTDQTQAECEDCGAILKSQRHLDLHMKRCHLVTAATHLCHLCPASFKVCARRYVVIYKDIHVISLICREDTVLNVFLYQVLTSYRSNF